MESNRRQLGFTGQVPAREADELEPEPAPVPFWRSPDGCGCKVNWRRYAIITTLVCVWIFFTVLMIVCGSNDEKKKLFVIFVSGNTTTTSIWIDKEQVVKDEMMVSVQGPFEPGYFAIQSSTDIVSITVELVTLNDPSFDDLINLQPTDIQKMETIVDQPWMVAVITETDIDRRGLRNLTKRFKFNQAIATTMGDAQRLRFLVTTNIPHGVALDLAYELDPIDEFVGITAALVVLVGLYILIGFELVHRALAAVLGSTLALAVLALLGERPSLEEIVTWIDVNTLTLLFAMMVIVAVLTKTGVFDYLSVVAYQITRGTLWPLIFTLCTVSGVVSSIIDVVTTVLLMTPVAIRLCEVLKLNPKPVLLAIIFSCNILCSLTPVGDPPNLIISNDPEVIAAGVGFITFMLHMGIGVILATIVLYIQLRFCFYRRATSLQFDEPTELRHELTVWQRTASSLSMYTRDEIELRRVLSKQVKRLERQLDTRRDSQQSSLTLQSNLIIHHENASPGNEEFRRTLRELKAKYPIQDVALLIKCGVAFAFAILFFFLHSLHDVHLTTAWTALLAAILLLIIADTEDIDGVLARVEWATLLFFAALFVLMECLAKLGLIEYVGELTQQVVVRVEKEHQLLAGIMLILWVSAFTSAIVDNVPLATMMLKIVVSLAKSPALNLPLPPLVWALAFGCSFGGNGTLIGSSANVVCTGVAEQHGYKITMWEFSKIGFPVMIVSIVVASVYLMIAHVVFTWH